MKLGLEAEGYVTFDFRSNGIIDFLMFRTKSTTLIAFRPEGMRESRVMWGISGAKS